MTILSRHAHAVRDISDFPDTVCRLIGQYAGRDIGYDPGDLFVRCVQFGNGRICDLARLVPYIQDISVLPLLPPPFRIVEQYVLGQQFNVYKVHRVTACQVTATLLKSYHAYQRYHEQVESLFFDDVRMSAGDTEMLFAEPVIEDKKQYRFRIKQSDQRDLEQFKMLDLSTAIPCNCTIRAGIVNGLGRLYFDYYEKTLIIRKT